jgi:hypothetical protein
MNDGLKIETAAGVTLRDAIRKHMASFALTISENRYTGGAVIMAYVDGLAGAMALAIAANHGSKEEIVNATLVKLRDSLDRDLWYLGKNNAKRQ